MLSGVSVPASYKPWLAQKVSARKPGLKVNQAGQCCKNTLCSFIAAFWLWCRKSRLSAEQKGECRLLADADALSIGHIQDAISLLQTKGWSVRTLIFADPRRRQNKKWRALMNAENIQFRPVERQSGFSDSNDVAITSELRRLAALSGSACLGLLLHGDCDFAGVVGDITAMGREIIVIILDTGRTWSFNAYAKTAAQVLPLPLKTNPCRVRATLLTTGEGTLHLSDDEVPYISQAKIDEICDVLTDRGYYNEQSFLPTCIAKYWVDSSLGSLCVFPRNFAIDAAVQQLHGQRRRQLLPQRNELCFVLPLSNKSKRVDPKYGSAHAWDVWKGGGPFLLQNSADLPVQVLSKLGYVDSWNTDVGEAMLVFWNCAHNKKNLRKLFLLPEAGDKPPDLSAKLREGFLSNRTAGTWRLAPKDKDVRLFLQKEGILQTTSASKSDCLHAMKHYVARQGLPSMRNYDSYVLQILLTLSGNDPSRREVLGPFLSSG